MSVMKFIQEFNHLEIHDISHAKIKSLELKMTHEWYGVKALAVRVESFIKDYQTCINDLSRIVSGGSSDGSIFLSGILKPLSDLINAYQVFVGRFEEQLACLALYLPMFYPTGTSTSKVFVSFFFFSEYLIRNVLC